jgi:hypothetical protein
MKAIFSRRPSPAMVVAVIALFAGTGGVGYAAATIDSGDIVNETIRHKDVKNRGLRGTEMKQNSVGGNAVKESTLAQVPSAATSENAANAANAQNAVNAQTAAAVGPGAVGSTGLQSGSVTGPKLAGTVMRSDTVQVPNGDSLGREVSCQAGERLISGGARWSGGMAPAQAAALHVVHSYPANTSTWFVRAYNNTGAPRDLNVRVLCLND